MMPTDYRVMPNFAAAINLGRPLLLYGGGNQTRTFCYITDAVKMIFKIIINAPAAEVFNIGNPIPEISIKDLAIKVKCAIDHQIEIKFVDYPSKYPKDDPSRRCPDISKYISTLHDSPVIHLDEGIERFFNWAGLNYPLLSSK